MQYEMSWSGRALLTPASRERCVARLRRQPSVSMDKTPPRTASVLIPLCVVDEAVSLLYTVRSPLLKNHSGQISFPGGMTDPGESAVQTALRETEEEIGLPRERVEVWGAGGALPGRNFEVLITPVVGFIPDYDPDELRPCANEVEEVFTVPVHELCNPDNQGYTKFNNYNYILPVFTYDKHRIWGLTAAITHFFLRCLVPKEHYTNDLSKNSIDPDEFIKPSKL